MSVMPRLSAALGLGFGLVLSLTLPASADSPVMKPMEPDWILNPAQVAAGQAFSLSLLSYRYSCATDYDHLNISAADGVISLGFTSRINPAVLCPMVYKPYGPSFRVPALKAGAYKVKAVLYQECHFNPAPCKSLPITEDAGVLTVGGEGRISYSLEPGTVKAGEAFSLKLVGSAFHCLTDFSDLASRIQESHPPRIVLTFRDTVNPHWNCTNEDGSFGPVYKMPALVAGTYEVFAERLPACVEKGCTVIPTLQLAGKLTVTDSGEPREGWFLKEKVVVAGAPFTLSLLNHEYGNCQTDFTHTSLNVNSFKCPGSHSITTSFVVEKHPERVCITDIRPHGPSFKVEALQPGIYPIYVNEMPACVFENPVCYLDPPLVPAPPVDTLQVMIPLGVQGGRDAATTSPAASWRDGVMSLRLPPGSAGTWRADLLTLSGKRLHSQAVAGEGEARLGLATRPERGVYLLRLVSPAGRTHTLHVPVQD
ncbi:MAG TPA: hypothetical protein VK465_14745 [Fibrobacteria bacterium]|nr:hypothetical protein [Fibrobacteria bacterium]